MIFMKKKLQYIISSEEGGFVARCLDVEVASEGTTEQEAVENLKEALELYFEDHEADLANLPPRTYQFGEVVIHA